MRAVLSSTTSWEWATAAALSRPRDGRRAPGSGRSPGRPRPRARLPLRWGFLLLGIASSREALIWVQVSSSSDPVLALPFFGFGALCELVIPWKKALILFFPVSCPNKKEDLPISSSLFFWHWFRVLSCFWSRSVVCGEFIMSSFMGTFESLQRKFDWSDACYKVKRSNSLQFWWPEALLFIFSSLIFGRDAGGVKFWGFSAWGYWDCSIRAWVRQHYR